MVFVCSRCVFLFPHRSGEGLLDLMSTPHLLQEVATIVDVPWDPGSLKVKYFFESNFRIYPKNPDPFRSNRIDGLNPIPRMGI